MTSLSSAIAIHVPAIRKSLRFLRRALVRRHTRDDDTESRATAGLRRHADAAAETAGHDIVHDVQAEAGAAMAATRREERLECAAPHFGGHAMAVVGEYDRNLLVVLRRGADFNGSRLARLECVGNGVEH